MAPDLRDEIDFRELLRKPSTLFGYAFLYVFAVLVVLGIYYAHTITTLGKNAIPPAVFEDSSSYVQDIPLQRSRELPPVDVREVLRRVADAFAYRAREKGVDFHADLLAAPGPEGVRMALAVSSPCRGAVETRIDLAAGETADLELRVHERSARGRVSRGQQKLLASALLLAQVELMESRTGPCVLLLDDPAAELDGERLSRLLARVQGLGSQCFITGLTIEDLAEFKSESVFHVEQGNLRRVL